MQWASALSTADDLDRALDETAAELEAQLDGARPDLLVAFASPLFAGLHRAPQRLQARFPTAQLVGCSGGGVIGDGREIEGRPALALTAAAMPEAAIDAFHLDGSPARWAEDIAVDPDEQPSFVLMPEPFSCDSQRLVRWLDQAYPGCTKLGGLASGARDPGGHVLFFGDTALSAGVVGVAVRGVEVETIVAQGCRPIGEPMFVTRTQRNSIVELDGRPAMSAVHELFETLSAADRELFRHSLFLGIAMRDAQQEYRHGDFLIRNLLGIDADTGALVVGALLRENQVVQFHLRDAGTSAHDLAMLLSRTRRELGAAAPAGALLFSCLGRGVHLYGEPDHDSSLFRDCFGPVPLGGFFCNGEIGPVQGRTFLHGYTSSFGLFRARPT